jgi:cellulose synthase/poly-beta-1,6-N-acetylglucosamine synthase-like glycosyltransferase
MKPETIALAVISLGLLVLAVYIMRSLDIYIASGCALLSDAYLLSLTSEKERAKISLQKPKKRIPALFFIVIGVPLACSVALGLTHFLGTPIQAILSTVMVVGFSVTFFFISFSIPLALRQKSLEKRKPVDPSYKPLVTVLVPAYNEELVIGRTLDSLIANTYEKKEIIVIDDGSIDNTSVVASWYKKFGVKVLTKENGGKARALNYGLLFSRGEIIITVDADSKLETNSIEEIVRLMSDQSIYAAAGNVKALNVNRIVTRLQELEYVTAINTMRRSLDMFGAIGVVPGAFGAFRKEAIEENGRYDPDTVAEDFDMTLKIQKAYGKVGASSAAIAYTEVPPTWHNLYRQRYRWAKGTYQALIKHKDAFLNERFGMLHNITMPLLLLSMIVPFATFTAIGAGVLLALQGRWLVFLSIVLLFTLIQFFVSLLSLNLDNSRLSLAAYSPLLVWGYRQFLDSILIYVTFSVAFSRKPNEWARVERVGGQRTEPIVTQGNATDRAKR